MANSKTGLHVWTGGREKFKVQESSLTVYVRAWMTSVPFDLEISFLEVKPKKTIGIMSESFHNHGDCDKLIYNS